MTKKTRILILEDQPTDAELEIRELRQAKLEFEAKCVETKETFLEALKEFDPDIIISDYGLPQFNGLEALRLLKELNLDIPFILCTGALTEEVAVKCMKEGAADYILKSSLKRLPSAVLNVLEKSEARQTKEEAVAALRESEEWLKALLDASRDGIVVEDNGEIVYINKSYAQQLKYDEAAELVGRHISEILPPDEAERLSDFGKRRLRGENVPSVYEFRGKRKDGTQVEVEGAVSTCVIGGKKYIMTAVRDITEQKRADAALRESEYKMRTLLGNMNEGLLQVDTADSIEFVNNRFCGMLGYSSPDELIGKIWSQLTLGDDEREFIKAVNKRRRQGISDNYELQMRKKTGETIWALVGGAPMIDAEGVTTGSMGVFTDITERKRAEEQMLHDAFHDSLTGLANRTLFMDHLHLTIERGKRRVDATFAVLFLDFDRFKVINDSLGHAEGDKLLMQIARRLETSLRPGDLVARLGGDEFTILLPELDDESDALRITERIQENLKGAFALAGREIFTSASIGIALSTAGHTQAEDMLRDADIAMYRAKAKGKAQFQVFDQEMHKDALAQMQLETEMRHALERGEFLLHYQPIINLETNNLMGFEALVRWKHPERGMVPPMEFIPAAEETGLILSLGKWILNESCRQMRQWQIGNPAAESLTVSVNLSSKQFQQPDLAEQVAAALDAAGLNPCCLKLEITESHIMENTESAIAMMNRLRNLGTEISLDDFGTGYSSLSYLHRFPVDYLKIDRSFVNRMAENKENAEIVNTIIKLAQNLKMKVIAEGIETAEQLAQLQQLNCEYGQGYFFSKPLEAEAANLFIGSGIINSAPVSNLSPVNFKLIG
jgi:diguanylate cyclase (GGDEF)-like protein/PAS domain S-box-containing protein